MIFLNTALHHLDLKSDFETIYVFITNFVSFLLSSRRHAIELSPGQKKVRPKIKSNIIKLISKILCHTCGQKLNSQF